MTKYDPDFMIFWKMYPPRWYAPSGTWTKVKKCLAQVQWRKLNAETKAFVMSIMPVYIKSIPATAIPDAFRWLRDKGFDDYIVPAPKKAVPEPPEPVFKSLTAEEKLAMRPKWMDDRMRKK